MSEALCTVVTGADGATCGKPAVTTFESRSGRVYAECADHAANVPAAVEPEPVVREHPRTRSRAPFVLVADGRIVGYAESNGPAVAKRAARLGARIVRNADAR